MSELSDMFADQFKRWLIHNGEGNRYGYYLSIAKIIDLRFLDGIKEQNVFEVTNLQTIEKIKRNVQKSKRESRAFAEFFDVYVKFLVEQDHSTGVNGAVKIIPELQGKENTSGDDKTVHYTKKEKVLSLVNEQLKRCRAEYEQVFDEPDDSLFFEKIKLNRNQRRVFTTLLDAFDKADWLFEIDHELLGNASAEIENKINMLFECFSGIIDLENVESVCQEIVSILDSCIKDKNALLLDAIDDEDEENEQIIRRDRKRIKNIKVQIENLFQIVKEYFSLTIIAEDGLSPKQGEPEEPQQIEDCTGDPQQPSETESDTIEETNTDPISMELLTDVSVSEPSEISAAENKYTVTPVQFEPEITSETIVTESVKPNLRINGHDILVYDWRDVTRRVCEYAINAKPFVMATIRAKSVVINGMSAFCRDLVLNPAYIRLSNGLQVLGNDDRESCKTICNTVCEHCGLRDMIEIK